MENINSISLVNTTAVPQLHLLRTLRWRQWIRGGQKKKSEGEQLEREEVKAPRRKEQVVEQLKIKSNVRGKNSWLSFMSEKEWMRDEKQDDILIIDYLGAAQSSAGKPAMIRKLKWTVFDSKHPSQVHFQIKTAQEGQYLLDVSTWPQTTQIWLSIYRMEHVSVLTWSRSLGSVESCRYQGWASKVD